MFGKKKDKKEHKPCLDCQVKIADANERATGAEDKFLRAAADLENYKKRQQREMDMYKKITVQSILLDFLPTIDELDLAIAAATWETEEGLQIIRDNLINRLKKHGVEQVESLGQPFNPHVHEGVSVMETEEFEEGIVMSVTSEGFIMDGFLLRPARVVVSKKP
jgi:molecular chaperone GrpE